MKPLRRTALSSWQSRYSSSPLSGGCFPLERHGKVLASEPDENFEVNCTIKPGTPVFFYFGSDCSDVEEPPFFGADEAEQAECATFVAHGWGAIVRLKPGQHTVLIRVTDVDASRRPQWRRSTCCRARAEPPSKNILATLRASA